MKRKLLSALITWKTSPNRKPLVLQGARQVGKTHLLDVFGREEYADIAYFNFEESPEIGAFFESSLDPLKIIAKLEIFLGRKIQSDKTLIVFDEVQLCPLALTSLKYFCEKAAQFHLACAGSMLGMALEQNTSFPVGKVNFLSLFPLSFEEFLLADGRSTLIDYLGSTKQGERIEAAFHSSLTDLLRLYLYVGGMPEAVKCYFQTKDLLLVRKTQEDILKSYLHDFSKHVPPEITLRIRALWESVPGQLARENKKFIFSTVSKSARARDYEVALQWLFDAGLLLRSSLVEQPGAPLDIVARKEAFKCYFLDVGLLAARLKLQHSAVVVQEDLLAQYRGALAENLVAQELLAYGYSPLYYWTSARSAELDFITEVASEVIPIEVKSGENRKSKSLHTYMKKYHPAKALRVSLGQFGENNNVIDLPLYMLAQAGRLLG